jgi:glutamyl-tRNA reductase
MLGAHQRTTPIAVLEQFTFSREALPNALQELRHFVSEGMIVSTCNRVEVYAHVPEAAEGLQALEDFLVSWNHGWLELPDDARRIYSEEAVVHHIFRLAAGLDSMVLGDDQIMGQIKSAYAASREAGITGKLLHRLVDRALASGKLVRTQTRITSHPVSVVSVALDQAEQHVGSLVEQRCLIIGAGRTAELALKLLESRHTKEIAVVNRTYERAARLGVRYQASSWPFDRLEQALAEHDVIISATTAPSFLVSRDMIERSASPHSRLFLDLSVPRSIDPDGVRASGDRLIDIEALQAISRENHAARASEIAQAEALINPEVQAFMEWRAGQSIVPMIRDLRAYAEEIRIAELRRALARLPDLTSEEQQAVGALSTAIVNKLLHHPIMALKDPDYGSQAAEALNQMLQLSRGKSRRYE